MRFAGRFSSDNWQYFNTFSVLYILAVYLPFVADFYRLFMEAGLRKLASYIAAELVVVQTIISLILLLEVLNHCTCGGLIQKDLGKRAGLNKKGGPKKRKAMRSGMGNEESDESFSESYDDEDDLDEGSLSVSQEQSVDSFRKPRGPNSNRGRVPDEDESQR